MDYLTRRHENYQALVRIGVMCGKLTGLRDANARWQLECRIVGDITNAEAKRAVEDYCRAEWEAQDFSFYTSAGSGVGVFKVRFSSWVL